ncbi:MAG: glycoside hydrolase family 15 protein [Thermoplasmata archaeon]
MNRSEDPPDHSDHAPVSRWGRLLRSPKFPADGLALADYGIVGNLHTAALISRHGSIDWACLPRFSSPSVFARLLDSVRGGYQRIAPIESYRSDQRYRPSSCVLETRFRLSRGRTLLVTDFMPIVKGIHAEASPMLLRILEAQRGEIQVQTQFAPRFEYGRNPPSWRGVSAGVEARNGALRMRYLHPEPLTVSPQVATAHLTLARGERASIELIWGARRPTSYSPERLLESTDRFWHGWVHSSRSRFHRLAREWHRWVERSELTLKLLSQESTGAFIAAPTTSIPEWPGGTRNWDYRYAWIRDSAFACEAMLDLGHRREARAFLNWAFRQVAHDPGHKLHVMYGAHGETDLRERSLPYLRGLWDSRPVRVGNQAHRQFQLDIYGELLDSALIFCRRDPKFLASHRTTILRLADQVMQRWRFPDRGIWEIRGPPVHFVHSKLMAWVALDRCVRLARYLGGEAPSDQWAREAEKIRTWILHEGYDEGARMFRRAQGDAHPDAANLRIPLVGFLPADDSRVIGTVDGVIRELCDGPFVYRYTADDGVHGQEGAFLTASFWLVECLARQGRVLLARKFWSQLLRSGTPLDLFAEEYAPRSAAQLGNFPQALTHIGLLRAALAIGEMETSTPRQS